MFINQYIIILETIIHNKVNMIINDKIHAILGLIIKFEYILINLIKLK